jgi:hypothetical protein
MYLHMMLNMCVVPWHTAMFKFCINKKREPRKWTQMRVSASRPAEMGDFFSEAAHSALDSGCEHKKRKILYEPSTS